jgi:fumarate reductase subunit D
VRSQQTAVQEAARMTSGFILLILIGILVAFGYTRLRGKMKLSVSGKNWIAPIVIVVIIALMLWASHNGSHTGH